MTIKKKIAFLGSGVYTIPSYRALLNKLCDEFDITAYFEVYKRVEYPISFSIRTVPPFVSKYRWPREIFFGLMVFRNFLANQPSLIHAHSTYPSGLCAILLGKIFGIPVIVSLDGGEASAFPNLNFGDLISTRRKKINLWVIKNATRVIVLTKFMRNEVYQNLKITREIDIIPRGVDASKFLYQEHEMKRHPLRILNVGYLHPVKDHETLLKTFALINRNIDSILILIGEDFSNGEVQRRVKEMALEDKVIFEGHISNDSLPEKYAKADLMLHTSIYESQAVVINEALACGLLVCGTNVGLLADLSGRCCLTVKLHDSEGLAMVVQQLLNSPEEIKRLRATGYEWSIQHDLQWTALQHKIIYDSL